MGLEHTGRTDMDPSHISRAVREIVTKVSLLEALGHECPRQDGVFSRDLVHDFTGKWKPSVSTGFIL